MTHALGSWKCGPCNTMFPNQESFEAHLVGPLGSGVCPELQHDAKHNALGQHSHSRQEAVDHPVHYGGGEDPYEHVKVMRAILQKSPMDGFVCGLLYNCTKYLWRLGQKDDTLQDAKKAQWYLNRLVEYLEIKT